MSGDRTGGFTIFYADDGLDTGPILLQKETTIDLNDTVDTFYNRFLYPEGKWFLCIDHPFNLFNRLSDLFLSFRNSLKIKVCVYS